MTSTPGWAPPAFGMRGPSGWVDDSRSDFNVTATFGGLTLSSRHDPLHLYAYRLQGVEGWEDYAPDDTRTMRHQSGDGDVALLRRMGARSIELFGYILAVEQPQPMLAVASRALRRVRAGVLTVDEHDLGQRLEVDARVVNTPTIRRLSPGFARFSIFLVADDPLRYSTDTLTLRNGSVAVRNLGDATLSPVLDLVGPHGAITITHPGGTYTFAALAAGQRRTLDWRNGDVWNGNVRVFSVEGGRRPAVLAGGSTWTVSGLGTGTATLRRFEAWT